MSFISQRPDSDTAIVLQDFACKRQGSWQAWPRQLILLLIEPMDSLEAKTNKEMWSLFRFFSREEALKAVNNQENSGDNSQEKENPSTLLESPEISPGVH